MVLDAKCGKCSKNATVDEEMKRVSCAYCGFNSTFDEYIELMKEKALNLSENFQVGFDKSPI